MDTFDADPAHFNPNNPYAGDDKIPVQFYMGVEQDFEATEREGRPIYKDVEFIRIFGGSTSIIDRPLRDTDKQRFARPYQHWKSLNNGGPSSVQGFPLENWPPISAAQVREYAYFHIHTVEQLAAVPDSESQKPMGHQKLKNLAIAYLEAAKGAKPIARMQREIEKRDGEIALLSKQLQDTLERLEALEKSRAGA